MSRHSKAKKQRKAEDIVAFAVKTYEESVLREELALVKSVQSLTDSRKDVFFRDTTYNLSSSLLGRGHCRLHPIQFSAAPLLREQFNSLHRRPYLLSGSPWSNLVEALLNLSFEDFVDFCRFTVDSKTEGSTKVTQAFVSYAKPHVDRGDWQCIFEIGLVDIGLPCLVQFFRHAVRVEFGID